MSPELQALVSQVRLEGGWTPNTKRTGGVVVGPPHVLAAVCRVLGFRNACSRGRVYLTGPKLVWLGLVSS